MILRKSVFFFALLLSFLQSGAQLGPRTLYSEQPEFSHQYTFLDHDRYYFVDTSFNSLHYYHQWNPRGQDNFGLAVLGSMGNPINNLSLPEVRSVWNYYTLGGYQAYFTNPKDIPFYHTRSPITEANYWMGYDRGQSFNIYHTQNINKDWNFVLNYSRLNDLGFYAHNRNIKSRFLANTSYINEDLGYEAHAYYLDEKMQTEENGGLANDTSLQDAVARVLLNVNLLNDSRNLNRREFFIDQNYALNKLLSKRDKDTVETDSAAAEKSRNKIAIGHNFVYSTYGNVYNGRTSEGFYDNYFFDNDGEYKDSTGYKSYSNSLYLLTEVGQKNRFELKAGLKNLITEYGGDGYRFTTSSWGLTGNTSGRLSDRLMVSASLDYILGGDLRESFDFQAQGRLKIFEWLGAFGGYQISSSFPEFFESILYTNNYIWENNFSKELINRLNYGIQWGKGNSLELVNMIANNYVYFNPSNVPQQSGLTLNAFQAKLTQNFTLWGFVHQDNDVIYQIVEGDGDVLPLPELVTRNSLYFEFNIFKKVLKCLAGVEMNYFSSYFSPSYDPATARFYNAREVEIGNYPLFDVFANFELRSARIFVKYEHVTEGLNGYRYFAAPHYAFPDRVLRIGITWRFFN